MRLFSPLMSLADDPGRVEVRGSDATRSILAAAVITYLINTFVLFYFMI